MRPPIRHALPTLLLVAGCGGSQSTSNPSVVYGDDDRKDLYDAANTPSSLTLAQATAALVKKAELSAAAGGFKLPTETFGTSMGLCADEPFREQPNPAFCSGFLVGADTLVTAGHCITSGTDCSATAFVFDFAYQTRGADPTNVPTSNVYYCREVVKTQALSAGADFAVIKLDRAVSGRRPVAFRREGKIEDNAPLVVIGHPSGLPTKIAAGANVRSNTPADFFVANLDTYGGNSGSAVFHAGSGVVEGILVRGEQDFTSRGSCSVSKRCASADCRGEDVTRATAFASFVGDAPPPPPPPPGDSITLTHSFEPLSVAIPDNNATGASHRMAITQAGKLEAVTVTVKIKHTYSGDLQVYLIHPDGTSSTLQSRVGGSTDDINKTFSVTTLTGKAAAGSWTLKVVDRAAIDVGKIESVKLTLKSKP